MAQVWPAGNLDRSASSAAMGSPDSKVYGANMGPTWGRQDPGGPHVGPMNLAISLTIWVPLYLHPGL